MTPKEDIVLGIICTTLFILLLISVIVIVFIISGRRHVQQQMVLVEAKLSFEKELRQVEVEVGEQVKGQFAQELHDNIGQLHTAMHIQIENQKLDHSELAESFKPLEIYLGEVTQQLRLLSRTLNTDYIGHIGLLSAISVEVERLTALKRFQVHSTIAPVATNLEKNQELMVFRIFQEITQNALRHSGAKNMFINVDTSGDQFELTVRDDGKGFDLNEILASQKASGLRNITKRARLAGIECIIQTSPGKGCLIQLKKVAPLNLGWQQN